MPAVSGACVPLRYVVHVSARPDAVRVPPDGRVTLRGAITPAPEPAPLSLARGAVIQLQRRTGGIWPTIGSAVVTDTGTYAVSGAAGARGGTTGPQLYRVSLYTAPSGVLVDVDAATLSSEAAPALRAIVADLENSHLHGTIRVEGYTDADGSDEYNLVLSRNRADTVATWLVEQAAVDSQSARGHRRRTVTGSTPGGSEARPPAIVW